MYTYRCELVRIIDGDTVVFNVDLGFGIWLKKEHVRFARINAPETRTKDLKEKRRGMAAANFVSKHLYDACEIKLTTFKSNGKFGRYIADVHIKYMDKWYCLNDLIVKEHHGVYKEY